MSVGNLSDAVYFDGLPAAEFVAFPIAFLAFNRAIVHDLAF